MSSEDKERPLILVVIGRLDLGGSEKHLLHVLPTLERKGYLIKIFVLSRGGYLEDAFSSHNIEILGIGPEGPKLLRLLKSASMFIYGLWRLRPRIIHFFLPEAYIIGGLGTLFAPRRKMLMSRRSLNKYQLKWPLVRSIEKFLHKRMDIVLANSIAVRDELVEEGVPRKKLKLIYNGVSISDSTIDESTAIRKKWHVHDDCTVIVMVANLIPYKGYKDLIHALAILARSEHSWHFVSIGKDSGIQPELEELARDLGVGDRITWEGLVEEVIPYLSAADIGVLSSHEEGFSNFILEAMTAKLPLVVTNVGGNAESVLDNVSGFVVPARKPEVLADRLGRLINNPALRVEFGDAAYKRVNDEFSMDTCVAKYETVYDSLLLQRV